MVTFPFLGGFLTAAVAVLLVTLAVHRREWRGGLLTLGMVFLAVAANEWVARIPGVSARFQNEPEGVAVAAFILAGLYNAVRWRGSTITAFAEIIRSRRFHLLVLGLLCIPVLSNIVHDRHAWALGAPGTAYDSVTAGALQDYAKGVGHLLLFAWAAFFVKDNWRKLIHRASPHEHLLRENTLAEIGRGARRICYRIGDTGFCVKFLRGPETYSDRKCGWRHSWSFRFDRFDRTRNLNCREAEAMEKYRRVAGPLVAAALPEVIEIVYDERRGYGILMSFLVNADGTPVRHAVEEMARQKDKAFSRLCYRQITALLKDLIVCSAPFFEPDNFEAQVAADGSVRIRIIDFEPCDKKLIPLEEHVAPIRRVNLRRKSRSVLKRMADVFECG